MFSYEHVPISVLSRRPFFIFGFLYNAKHHLTYSRHISGTTTPDVYMQENKASMSILNLISEPNTNIFFLQRLVITSEAFQSKPLLARQRMVNTLLKEELAREGGIHALQLKTRTPEEEEKLKAKEAAQ
jgi:acid stress-induced BolA-like protein IbaG/YrbA